MMQATIDVERVGDVHVLKVRQADVLQIDSVRDVRRRIGALPRNGHAATIVLDLEDVTLISSEALGMLVAINNVLRTRGGEIRLANVSAETRSVMEIIRLDRVIRLFDSTASALAAA